MKQAPFEHTSAANGTPRRSSSCSELLRVAALMRAMAASSFARAPAAATSFSVPVQASTISHKVNHHTKVLLLTLILNHIGNLPVLKRRASARASRVASVVLLREMLRRDMTSAPLAARAIAKPPTSDT